MARTAGVDIPRDKRVVVPLTYIYGTSNTIARKILADAGVSEGVRTHELANEQADTVRAEVDRLKAERDLHHEVNLNIKRLMEIGPYRGIRHRRGLPIHGRNTKNNARTRKGPVRAIADKKK